MTQDQRSIPDLDCCHVVVPVTVPKQELEVMVGAMFQLPFSWQSVDL